MHTPKFIALTVALAAPLQTLRAQSAATFPLGDPVYRLVDQLAARVPTKGVITDQRPYSRRETARMARSFAAELARRNANDPRASSLLSALVAAIGDTATGNATVDAAARGAAPVRVLPLETATLGAVASGEAPRLVPTNGFLGSVDARTVPALDARGGRPVVHGVVTSLETSHVLGLGSGLAFVAEPRVSVLAPSSGGSDVSVMPQRLVARGVWRNVALQGGIDAIAWGPVPERGLVFSENAAPLRALTLGTDRPVHVPWLGRIIGPLRPSIVVVDLGRDQVFPHSKIATYKLTSTPWSRVEIGAAIFSEFGGHGAPTLSFRDRLLDLVPYVTWVHPGSDVQGDKLASNKVAQGDLRVAIPELAGLTLYYEGAVDDLDFRRLKSVLWQDTAHLLGARFDGLRPDGTLSLDVQLHHTSLRIYEHYQFTSGLEYQQHILGDPLGPNAAGGYATLAWRPMPLTELALRASLEQRDASPYTTTAKNELEDAFTFVRLASVPIERRGRLDASLRRDVLRGLGVTARLGAERIANEGFKTRDPRWQAYGEAGVTLRR